MVKDLKISVKEFGAENSRKVSKWEARRGRHSYALGLRGETSEDCLREFCLIQAAKALG
jgi:hypothetical protein